MSGYLEFKLSWGMFQKAPNALAAGEQVRLQKVAARQRDIEGRLLESREAVGVTVPFPTLDARLAEVRGRYATAEEYRADLERIGLTEASLSEAVYRELMVEAVMDKVSAAVPSATALDAEIYFRLNPGAFERPEMRRLRHILITFNDASEQAKVRALLENLRPGLRTAEDFAAAALRHSHCPTSLQGGEMGSVKRGQIYPELEPAAFALAAGGVSTVLQSPMGLHLLRCDEILAGQTLAFDEVCQKIVDALTDKRRRSAQEQWIKSLPAASVGLRKAG